MDIGRLERAYRTFVRCHDVVVAAEDEARLLHDVCDLAVHELGFRLAWVGTVTRGDERVRPMAQAGYEAGFLDSLHITWTDGEHGRGPTGRAIREQRPCVSQDLATDPAYAPWRADALKRGYASSAAIPLCSGAECFGAMCLYAAEPNAFDDAEVALLEEMAVDLVLGIMRIRTSAKLRELDRIVERAARAEIANLVASEVAHDVNNLLQVLVGSIAGAQEASDPAEREADLAEAARASASASSMMRQFIALSRRSVDPDGHVEVDRLVRSLRSLLARLVPDAFIELCLEASGAVARISSIDLERVIINLVVNAGHASPPGSAVTVSTGLRRVGPEGLALASGPLARGAYVELTVADAGEGIPEDILQKVFEPYFTTKGDAGTGLGLASVHALTRAAGGGVTIASTVGQGTRVTVLLPLATSS
jgi:signal transduction histidine kinase